VATFLSKRRCPTIYRIHGTPDEAKLERVAEVAELLSVSFDLDEMLEPRGVSKWLQRIAKHEKKQVLEMLVLRSLKQAQYDIVNIGHFGLASDNYLHFTSPIRRYPDIEVHRAVKRLLRGGKPDTSASAIEALRAAATLASLRERAALNVEREVVDLHRALLMRSHLGETLEGTVTSVVGSGLYVTLDDPFVDVLVRYEALGPDRYEAEDHELSVVGIRSGDRVMVGDRIVVTIDDVAILRRTVYARRVVPDGALRRLDGPRRGKQRGKDKRGKDQLPARASRGSERKSQGPAQASTRSPSKPSKQGKRRKRR
jgi:ribonuclease R